MFVNYISLEPIKNNSIIIDNNSIIIDNNSIHLPFLFISRPLNNIVKIQINQDFPCLCYKSKTHDKYVYNQAV